MKSHEQITARIEELRNKLKQARDDPRRHRRGQPGHLGNLGAKRIGELQGEMSGLKWVLESDGGSAPQI